MISVKLEKTEQNIKPSTKDRALGISVPCWCWGDGVAFGLDIPVWNEKDRQNSNDPTLKSTTDWQSKLQKYQKLVSDKIFNLEAKLDTEKLLLDSANYEKYGSRSRGRKGLGCILVGQKISR